MSPHDLIQSRSRFRRGHRRIIAVRATLAFAAALVCYGATAWVFGHAKADPVYFDHLAEAFLRGRLDLANPPGTHDLSEFEGKWFVPFPPLPALLMLPIVAFRGASGVNAVVFSIVFAAGSIALTATLLDALAARRMIRLRSRDRCWIVLFFLAGSVHWYVAVEGSVWFLSQICTVFFLALSANFALWRESPLPASAALALAMAARPHVVLTWPLLYGLSRARTTRRRAVRWVIGSLAGPIVAVVGLAAYNQARFESPFDFGYYKQKIEAGLMDPLFSQGQFSIEHIPRNLNILFLQGRVLDRPTGRWIPDDHGMSILLTSPALLWIAFSIRRKDPAIHGAWIAAGLLIIPLLLYYNTGWRQFGYRFILDLMIPLLVLLAAAAGRRIHPLLGLLILISVAVNLMGTVWWFTEVSMPRPAGLDWFR